MSVFSDWRDRRRARAVERADEQADRFDIFGDDDPYPPIVRRPFFSVGVETDIVQALRLVNDSAAGLSESAR